MEPSVTTPPLQRDPVCGMNVNPSTAKHTLEHAGKMYYFCCGGCATKFKADPEGFLSKPASGLVMLGMPSKAGPAVAADPATDPVCGMMVNPANAKHIHEHSGKTFYFCCAGCLQKFTANPAMYLDMPSRPAPSLVTLSMPVPTKSKPTNSGRQAPQATSPTYYVCPMCPEVREAKPVPCPSCGMALEPENPLLATRTEYTCPMHPEIVRSEPGSCPICGMALEPRTVTAVQEENPELRDMTRRF